MNRQRLVRTSLVGTSIFIVSSVCPANVYAGNFSSNTGATGCTNIDITANNANEYVKYHNLSNLMTTATDNALSSVYAPTDLSIFMTTSDTTADVIVKDYDLTNQCTLTWDGDPDGELIAWNYCNDANAQNECDTSVIVYDDDNVDDSAAQRAYMACHEMGHAVGIEHKTEGAAYTGVSCMAESFAAGRDDLTTHDIGELNAWYPESSG